MSGRVALRIPVQRRLPAPHGWPCAPWFARSGRAVPGSAPALLTFDDADFLERFLAGVAASPEGRADGAFPRLKPLRDWSEPPRTMLDAAGAPRFDTTKIVRDPVPAEVAEGEGALDAEAVVAAEESASGQGWLRKLYLPTHRHFHLVALELVCDRPERPRLDPARVVEVGAVVRRLVPDAGSAPRWEDWVPAGEGKGTWVELADAEMRGAGLAPLDPAVPVPLPSGDTTLRTRLGLGPADPLPPLAPVRLLPLPPAEGAGHTAYFAFLPVQSADCELPVDPVGEALGAVELRAEAEANLSADVGARAPALRDRVRAAWSALLDVLGGPDTSHGRFGPRPDAGVVAASQAGLQVAVNGIWPPPASVPTISALVADVDRLARAMREEATSLEGGVLPVPEWTGTTSVTSRWIALSGTEPSVTAVLQTNAAVVGDLLRDTLYDALDDALAAPWSATPTPSHRVVAAVLLWVRAHRLRLLRALRDDLAAVVGGGDGLEPEARVVWDPHAPGVQVPLVTVGSLAGELEAFLAADDMRATAPLPWPPLDRADPVGVHVVVHGAAFALEDRLAEIGRLGAGGGGGWPAAMEARAAALRGDAGLARGLGLDLDGQPEQGLLVLGALDLDVAWPAVQAAAVGHYDDAAAADAVAVEARGRTATIRPRFDPDHVYTVWAYARLRCTSPCVADRLVWTARTEPFTLADPMDVLGLKPVPMRLPDVPRMLRDLPRIARAGALPVAAVTTPPDSGFTTGETPADSARAWGIAWICSIGIPVFTIVAWILFSIVFSILILIPGFAWMLLLKICIPVPVPRRT